MDHRIDNETLNKAILTVLQAKFKKDEPDAFDLVTSEGYDVSKSKDGWLVENPHTGKVIRKYYYMVKLNGKNARREKVDFVSYLDKPFNEAKKIDKKESEFSSLLWEIDIARRDIAFYDKEIERALEDMERAKKRLMEAYKGKDAETKAFYSKRKRAIERYRRRREAIA